MTNKTLEIVETYSELDRAIHWCLPEEVVAIEAELGGWVIEIKPKVDRKCTLRRAFDTAAAGRELLRVLNKLRDLDDIRKYTETYYSGGWWYVEIRRKDEPDTKLKGADYVAAYFARLYKMNDNWCNLTVFSGRTRLTIEGSERGRRTKTLIVDEPRGEIWEEAEELVRSGMSYQGVVKGDLNREVKYDLRRVKSCLERPSVTLRDKNKIIDYEGRAVQVTELPAMTVITLWKEIEYK